MGWDICGWIECHEKFGERNWVRAVDLHFLYQERNYDAFGCLFGWQNYAQFRPIAASRGFPADVSAQVKGDFMGYGETPGGLTWVTWAEIKAIDWEEEAEAADSRIHKYWRAENGELIYQGKAVWDRDFAELVESQRMQTEGGIFQSLVEAMVGKATYPEGQQWERDGIIFRAEKLKRKESLEGSDWNKVFAEMETLASHYGDDGVRLVVWFIC